MALARSLAPAPRLVLLDEPLTGLDRDLHDHLAGEVGRILRAAGTTAILVTHDPQEAARRSPTGSCASTTSAAPGRASSS